MTGSLLQLGSTLIALRDKIIRIHIRIRREIRKTRCKTSRKTDFPPWNYIFINDIFSFVVIWKMSRRHSLHSGCEAGGRVRYLGPRTANTLISGRTSSTCPNGARYLSSSARSHRTKNFCCYVRIWSNEFESFAPSEILRWASGVRTGIVKPEYGKILSQFFIGSPNGTIKRLWGFYGGCINYAPCKYSWIIWNTCRLVALFVTNPITSIFLISFDRNN